jgi:ferredoxin-NADP reductase
MKIFIINKFLKDIIDFVGNRMTTANPPRRKKGWMKLTITKIIQETPDTKTFVFTDQDEPTGLGFDYEAGQYLTIRFDHIGPRPLVRSYTMSSAPREQGYAAITIKQVEQGVVSSWLMDNVKPGDLFLARGPIGKFCFQHAAHNKRLFMIGAGSGITPFISIAKEFEGRLGQDQCPGQLGILGIFRSRRDIICASDLSRFRDNPSIDTQICLTREEHPGYLHGRPDTATLDKVVGSYDNTTFMICGPEEMMDAFKIHINQRGVAPEHILTESFFS